MTRTTAGSGFQRSLAGGALVALGVATTAFCLLNAPQNAAAATGSLAIEPAQGEDDWGNIRLVTSGTCPEQATNIVVTIVGDQFPQGSNAVGNSELAGISPAPAGQGLVIPLLGSWDVVARANNAKVPLEGTATLSLICTDFYAAENYGEMTGTVIFDRSAAGGPSKYRQLGGPELSSGLQVYAKDATKEPEYVYKKDAAPAARGTVTPPSPATEEVSPAAGEVASDPPVTEQSDGYDPGSTAEDVVPTADGAESAETVAESEPASRDTSAAPVILGGAIAVGAAAIGGLLYLRRRPT